jgi:hypothetical protein
MKHILVTLLSSLSLSSLLLSLLLTNCQSKKEPDWRYEIKGQVFHKGQWHDAIWYTDTIELGDNYATYQNSDGSRVIIPAPFILIDHKFDKVTKDTIPAF